MNKVISFVIPVFRNEGSIKATYQEIVSLPVFASSRYGYQIVFINDGSDDGSEQEIRSILRADEKVTLINFSRNFGQVAAIIAGMRLAKGSCTIVLSADQQDPLHVVNEMIALWENGNEIVIATREERDDTFVANISSAFFYGLMHRINPKIPRGGFDFFLLSKKPRKAFNKIEEGNRFLQGDVLWLGFQTIMIPYTRKRRAVGKSQWTLSKKLKYLIDGFLTTSYVPIRLISLFGLSFAFFGLLYTVLIIYNYFVNSTPFNGWAPIMIIILITSGMIMFMLGIIGEYLWRAFDESRKRQQYIIKEVVNNTATEEGLR